MVHGGDFYGNAELVQRARDRRLLDFSVNTNPLGSPDAVKAALAASVRGDFERYPDPYCRALRAAIAQFDGVPQEAILCGAGASDIIFRLCLAKKPRTVLLCAPTFSEYEKAASLAGARIVHYPMLEADDFRLTERFLDFFSSVEHDMLFLCNPNNPTSSLIEPDLLAAIVRRCQERNVFLVLDECFLPFTGRQSPLFSEDGGKLGKLSKKIACVRAFTKTFSLAGLRIGYMVCPDEDLIAACAASGPFWNVSVPAQAAALAALQCSDWFERSRALIETERAYLTSALRELGLKVFDSDANFILFRTDNEQNLAEKLLASGILLRSCANFRNLDGRYYRICVKTHECNERLIVGATAAFCLPCNKKTAENN
ncbi:MAG: aminotransferase class I/II-fold pyridoxal phosphate-dependent enzyme [Spirochaetaceae bacterium]|jgi:threonine-phosphate decarboxylase|nr:aminotransferase class I/II-fold pyridoxal phosphate-dependent enzyme [Spirochaetaceae bacterium]